MNKKIEFTSDELQHLRDLISGEMLKSSDILDKIGNSTDTLDKINFSYWYDKYQLSKVIYFKLQSF